MAKVELIMPKMGESVSEATIITWNKNIGDLVELDETIIEIATDKVDSEVPSTHEGKLVEMLFQVDDVVQVGEPFAIIEVEAEASEKKEEEIEELTNTNSNAKEHVQVEETSSSNKEQSKVIIKSSVDRFYSPLVKSMASKEGIDQNELENISGTGKDGRVTKSDMINYLNNRKLPQTKTKENTATSVSQPTEEKTQSESIKQQNRKVNIPNTGEIEIVEMDRMRKLISDHMTMSKSTSAHITSMVEVDMTNIVNWRNSVKEEFKSREGQNITFTPIIIEAMAKAVKDFL